MQRFVSKLMSTRLLINRFSQSGTKLQLMSCRKHRRLCLCTYALISIQEQQLDIFLLHILYLLPPPASLPSLAVAFQTVNFNHIHALVRLFYMVKVYIRSTFWKLTNRGQTVGSLEKLHGSSEVGTGLQFPSHLLPLSGNVSPNTIFPCPKM